MIGNDQRSLKMAEQNWEKIVGNDPTIMPHEHRGSMNIEHSLSADEQRN